MGAIIEIDSNTKPDSQGRYRAVIGDFGPKSTKVRTVDQGHIGTLATFVLTSFIPGNAPVIGIAVIGHTDSDVTRDKEQQMSDQRAQSVKMELVQDVQMLGAPLPDLWNNIIWEVKGVGASEPDERNASNKNTLTMSEEERKRNRRVVVIFTTADPATRPLTKLSTEKLQKILDASGAALPTSAIAQPPVQRDWYKRIPPPVRVNGGFKAFIKKVRDNTTLHLGKGWQGTLDPAPLFQSAKDAIGGAPPTLLNFNKELQDDEKEHQTREDNPPELQPLTDPTLQHVE
jgi:outer membrane protein OmpA-like peptidoglycan-associated protein